VFYSAGDSVPRQLPHCKTWRPAPYRTSQFNRHLFQLRGHPKSFPRLQVSESGVPLRAERASGVHSVGHHARSEFPAAAYGGTLFHEGLNEEPRRRHQLRCGERLGHQAPTARKFSVRLSFFGSQTECAHRHTKLPRVGKYGFVHCERIRQLSTTWKIRKPKRAWRKRWVEITGDILLFATGARRGAGNFLFDSLPAAGNCLVRTRLLASGCRRHCGCMPTREEIQAKSDASQLKNLLAKQGDKTPLSPREQAILKRLKAGAAKTTAPK